jgi:hypothetical protein
MTTAETTHDWVPEACTLPTAQQPLRVAEFDALFAKALHGVDRATPTRLRLVLSAAAEPAARDLAARETACCSFFAVTFDHDQDGQLLMTVAVPAAHVDVLDALARRATTGGGVAA